MLCFSKKKKTTLEKWKKQKKTLIKKELKFE